MKALTFKEVNKLNNRAIYHISPFAPVHCTYDDDKKSCNYGAFYVWVGFPKNEILVSVRYYNAQECYAITSGIKAPIDCTEKFGTFEELLTCYDEYLDKTSHIDLKSLYKE